MCAWLQLVFYTYHLRRLASLSAPLCQSQLLGART